MPVIRIEEIMKDDRSMEIRVDGVLDRNSVAELQKVCHRYLNQERNIVLNLKGMIHITREGRDYLREIKDRVSFVDGSGLMNFS